MNFETAKNVKIKADFVVNNLDKILEVYYLSSTGKELVKVLKRDGIKCDCCGESNVYYRLSSTNALEACIIKQDSKKIIRLTADHDYLRSLGGPDKAENYHALCETCNSVRDDRFAEYPEFKMWYTKRKESGKAITRAAQRNFCQIDFNEAVKDGKNHILYPNGIPLPMQNRIREVLKNTKSIKSAYGSKIYRRVPNHSLNQFLTELAYEEASKIVGFDVVRRNIANPFNIVSPKAFEKLKDKEFLSLLAGNFKNTINNIVVQNRKQQVLIVHAEAQPEHKLNFWQRLVKAISVLKG